MPDYYMEWEGHIDERKRPEGFPKSVFVKEQYGNIESDEEAAKLYNSRVKTMILNPGLIVMPENESIDMTSIRFDQRIFIPWHMITHFSGRIRMITPAAMEPAPLEKLTPVDPPKSDKKDTVQ